jgi:hypothetical protein
VAALQQSFAYQSQTLQALTYSYPEPGKDRQCCKLLAEIFGRSGVEIWTLRKIIRPEVIFSFLKTFDLRKQTISMYGAFLYAPYRFLLISDKFLMGGGGHQGSSAVMLLYLTALV